MYCRHGALANFSQLALHIVSLHISCFGCFMLSWERRAATGFLLFPIAVSLYHLITRPHFRFYDWRVSTDSANFDSQSVFFICISIPLRLSRMDKASLADNVHHVGGLVVNIPSWPDLIIARASRSENNKSNKRVHWTKTFSPEPISSPKLDNWDS